MHDKSALRFRRTAAVACLLGVSLSSTSSASAAYLPLIRGSILSYAATNHEGYGGDIAYGTVTKFPTVSIGVPNPDPVSCVGQRCFALGNAGAFQYPAISTDHGRTWRIGGHWFAGAWADAAAFASRMTALSATDVVAWMPTQNTGFYSTSSAGRRWCAVVWPGQVIAVTGSDAGHVITVTIAGFDDTNSKVHVQYSSSDGGLVWRLDH
jgi:hypothetical protein